VRNPLEEVASWATEARPKLSLPQHGTQASAFDVDAFIVRHGLRVRREGNWNGAGRKWELELCPFRPDEHTGGCAVITQAGDGKLGYKCQHHSCADKHWHEFRELLEPRAQRTGNYEPSAPNGAPKMRSVSEVASIREYASQKIDSIVEGIIAAGTVTAFTGESGAGKTTLVTAICSAVERGVPFAGLATQRRPVLILDKENPLSVVVERFDRLGIQDGPNFKVWGGWAPEEPPAPFSPIVIEWVKACEPKPLIVVDSLVSFHGGNENDATETRAYMQGFRRLADLGATVIVLHNSGKSDSAKEYRGSSDIKASIDVGYHLANLGDSLQLGILRLKAFKARFSVQPEIILNYRAGRFEIDGRGATRTNQEILQQLLIENPGIQAKRFEDIAPEKGVARNKARDFLATGIVSGAIRVDKGQHNTRFHTWVGADVKRLC
jgi:archaellum biogenesis ATPase FlaH